MKTGVTQKSEDLRNTIPSQYKQAPAGRSIQDHRSEAASQRKVQDHIQSSLVVLAQQQYLKGLSRGGPETEGSEGEGLIQGKFVTQRVGMDEEELK